jgi:hypothetical protein
VDVLRLVGIAQFPHDCVVDLRSARRYGKPPVVLVERFTGERLDVQAGAVSSDLDGIGSQPKVVAQCLWNVAGLEPGTVQ